MLPAASVWKSQLCLSFRWEAFRWGTRNGRPLRPPKPNTPLWNYTHPLLRPDASTREPFRVMDAQRHLIHSFRLRKSALMIFWGAFLIIGIDQQAALQVNSGFSEFRLLNAVWR